MSKFAGYGVEYAKSNRSTCRGCKSKIAKNHLRFATKFYGEGDWVTPSWYHQYCFGQFRPDVLSNDEMQADMDKLDNETKIFVRELCNGISDPQSDLSPREEEEANAPPPEPKKKATKRKKKAVEEEDADAEPEADDEDDEPPAKKKKTAAKKKSVKAKKVTKKKKVTKAKKVTKKKKSTKAKK